MRNFGDDLVQAITGNLAEAMEGEIQSIERAAMDAAYSVEGAGKRLLRADIVRGGLGDRMSRTWQSKTFPDRTQSMNPTVYFKNTAPLIVNAFEQGVEIRAKRSRYLAVPSEDLLKSLSSRGRSHNRKDLVKRVESKFGPLEFVPLKGKRFALLVAKNLQKSRGKRGGFRAASDLTLRKKKQVQAVMFILVPQVRLRKRLNFGTIQKQLERDWPRVMAQKITENLAD